MAILEKLRENNFTTKDSTTLYVDNEGVETLRKNMLSSVEKLVLDTSAFDIEDEINGTECVQELINQWHKVAETTDNYRNFYIDHVNPAIIRTIKSVNDTAQEIADALDGDESKSINCSTNVVKTSTKNAAAPTQKAGKTTVNKIDEKYAQYMTGDEAVDAEIIRLFEDYEEDLSGLYEDMDFSWENSSETTRKALSRIAEVDINYIDNHLSDKKCANNETRVETILMFISNGVGAQETTIFNSEYIKEVSGYMTSDSAKQYMSELAELQRGDFDYAPGLSMLNIRLDGVGVIFEFEDTLNGDITEILCHTSEERTRDCIEYWEKQKPGCFNHEYGILMNGSTIDEARENLVNMYTMAENSADCEFLDRLFKADSSYTNVFTDDPEKLSTNVQLIIGNHMNAIASDKYKYAGYSEYESFVNAAIDSTYEREGLYYYRSTENLKLLATSSSLVADTYRASAWTVDLNDCADFEKQFNIASQNELFMFSLYDKACEIDSDAYRRITGIDLGEDFDFKEADNYFIKYNHTVVEQTNEAGLTNYGVNFESHIEEERYSIEIKESIGGSANNEISRENIKNIQDEKEEAEKDLVLDKAIDIVGIFCPEASKALSKSKEIIDTVTDGSYGEYAEDQMVDTGKDSDDKRVATGATLLSALSSYNDIQEKYEKALEKENEREMVSTFFSNMNYSVDGEATDHYNVMNFEAIKLIREWDEEGISALYSRTEGEEYGIDTKETIIESYQKLLADGTLDEENIKVLNTLIYGADEGKDTYNSIAEIPVDLLVNSMNELNGNFGERRDIENQITAVLDPNK